MSEHPNAAMVRAMNDAMSAGDMQKLADALADDVVWHEIGNPEPVRGKAALNARYMGDTPPDYQITAVLHDVLASDDHTIAMTTATATRHGKTFTYRTAEIYHIKDGKITERWAFSDDTDAINKFFA
jgi:uncharacterized protein